MLSKRALYLRHVAKTNEEPLAIEIERGEGMYLYGPDEKAYLDMIAGISVSNLGHHHPKIVAAVQQQAATYMHTLVYGEFVLEPQAKLAGLLCDQLPENLDSVYFANSGTEAIEGAMKLAKRVTGNAEIISAKNAYHGSTQGAASLMSDDYFTGPYRPLLPGIKHIEYNNFEDLQNISKDTAAVVIEVVQAESGITPPVEGYLQALRQRCDETCTLLVFDEIQTGCGRTGQLFAFQKYGVVPDVLVLAKGFGGGMPLGAFVSSSKMMHTLTNNPVLGHITTFGGHPVCCAAALASLQCLIDEPQLIASVQQKEALLRELLTHPEILEIRSSGLFMGLQLRNFEMMWNSMQYCLEHGLIIDWFLFNDATLRIAPPLIISEEEIHKAASIILSAINHAAAVSNK